MGKIGDRGWSVLFALSVGLLMLTVLLTRSEPVPLWVLIVYPTVGGMLALTASRTSPTAEQMAWIESGAIAAAAVIVLAGLVNVLLIDMLMRQMQTGAMYGAPHQQVFFFAAPTVAVLLWWALQRRLSRMRLRLAERRRMAEQVGIPAE